MRYTFPNCSISLSNDDALNLYASWPAPTVIISDGAYGVGGFPGDPKTAAGLLDWYRPHIEAWAERATPQTTLWFWGTELSWATVHPLLEKNGWVYKAACIWDKGIAHVAGNVNTQTLTHLPIVTEICVQYTRRVKWSNRNNGETLTIQEWLRQEWRRTGLPFSETNTACGVANAASRKYFAADHQWYFPPGDMMAKIAEYANQHGDPKGKPYFDLSAFGWNPNGNYANTWDRIRAKFYCPLGVTNVWREGAVRGKERVKRNGKAAHLNQKPLSLIRRLIEWTSDPGDVVWDAFGGLYTTAIASAELGRSCYSAEISPEMHQLGQERFESYCREAGIEFRLLE